MKCVNNVIVNVLYIVVLLISDIVSFVNSNAVLQQDPVFGLQWT